MLEQVPEATVFQTHEWFDSWRGVFAPRREGMLLTATEQDELLGIAPLVRSRGPLGLRQIEFAASRGADYQSILARPDRRQEVVRAFGEALAADSRSWDMLVLRNLSSDSAMLDCMRRGFSDAGLHQIELERVACPTLKLGHSGQDALERIDRYSLRRRTRGLERLGPVELRLVHGESDIEAALPVLFEQHRRRWAASGRPSQFHDTGQREFFRRLAIAADRAGWLHFSTLYCGDRIIACHLGFRFRDRLYWYKPSFDLDFARYSPGIVLLAHLIREAAALGLAELDFTVGDEDFKRRYANAQRINVNLRLFHGRALHAAGLAYGKTRLAVRDLYHAVRRGSRSAAATNPGT